MKSPTRALELLWSSNFLKNFRNFLAGPSRRQENGAGLANFPPELSAFPASPGKFPQKFPEMQNEPHHRAGPSPNQEKHWKRQYLEIFLCAPISVSEARFGILDDFPILEVVPRSLFTHLPSLQDR